MTALPFDWPLIAASRRIGNERVELDHDEPPAKDPWIRELHEAGYIRVVFTPAFQRRPDFWRLTDAGQEWLRDAAADAVWSHTSGPNP